MAKYSNPNALDACLNWYKTNAIEMVVCSSYPTTYEEASATYALADIAIDAGDFVGPIDGDIAGERVLAVNNQDNVLVDVSGSSAYIALLTTNSIAYVTSCGAKTLVAGKYTTIPSWDITSEQPT